VQPQCAAIGLKLTPATSQGNCLGCDNLQHLPLLVILLLPQSTRVLPCRANLAYRRVLFSSDQSFPLAGSFAYSVYQFQSKRVKRNPEGPFFAGNAMVGAIFSTLCCLAVACAVSGVWQKKLHISAQLQRMTARKLCIRRRACSRNHQRCSCRSHRRPPWRVAGNVVWELGRGAPLQQVPLGQQMQHGPVVQHGQMDSKWTAWTDRQQMPSQPGHALVCAAYLSLPCTAPSPAAAVTVNSQQRS
jgi:hypothetical protein